MKIENVSRRQFLSASSTLVLTAALPVSARTVPTSVSNVLSQNKAFAPSVYLSINTSGTVTVTAHRSEMGQGIRTALTQIIADELDADWHRVVVTQARGDVKYGDQNTDGSQSIRLFYDTLRHAGASARLMLQQAAAERWSVATEDCVAAHHRVTHQATGRTLDYGELAEDAATLPVPETVAFKTSDTHRYIGKPQTHVDINAILDGRAPFGADIRLPGMIYAVVSHCPWLGGGVEHVDEPEPVSGYLGYEIIDPPKGAPAFAPLGGVAILAEDTFTAASVADTLDVQWTDTPHKAFDSGDFVESLRAAVQNPSERLFDHGNIDAAFNGSGKRIEALYETPFLSHAPMEPPCAVAAVTSTVCEVWAPVQDPQSTRALVARTLNYPLDKVHVNVTLLGGAFGRKSKPDFVLEAVELSRRRKRPVRVTWRREDDIQHDYYHAASAQYHRAMLDTSGTPVAWLQRTAFASITTVFSDTAKLPADWELEMGFSNLPYRVANQRFEHTGLRPSVRIGWMRSVCNVFHSFSANAFIDEMAVAAGQDPIAYRLALLGDTNRPFDVPGLQPPTGHSLDLGRLRTVIERVRELSDWDNPRPAGRGLGFAVHHSFRSYVAMVLDVSVDAGKVVVHDAFVVLDCGTFINPDTCEAQMQGAVVFGLSLALYGEITVAEGAVQQSNFHDYPVLRMSECPRMHVQLVDSDALPAGVGEPGVPPVAPALSNAIFAATGQRYRKLPIKI